MLTSTDLLRRDLLSENDQLKQRIEFLQAQVQHMHLSEVKLNCFVQQLEKDLADAQSSQPFAVAILDAACLPFDKNLVFAGQQGGRQAASQLIAYIRDSLPCLASGVASTARVLLFCLFDPALLCHSHDSFLDGFSSVDDTIVIEGSATVRRGKAASILDSFLAMDQVKVVLLGGQAPPPHLRPSSYASGTLSPEKLRWVKSLAKIHLMVSDAAIDNDCFVDGADFGSHDACTFSRICIPGLFNADPNPSSAPSSPFSFHSRDLSDSGISVGSLDIKPSSDVGVPCPPLSPVSSVSSLSIDECASPPESPLRVPRNRSVTAPGNMRLGNASKDDKKSARASRRRHASENGAVGTTKESSKTFYYSYASLLASETPEEKALRNAKAPRVDGNKSLSRQSPPPCNMFYLTNKGCRSPACKYSHAYRMNSGQLAELKKGASHTACNVAKNGVCPLGSDCPYGH